MSWTGLAAESKGRTIGKPRQRNPRKPPRASRLVLHQAGETQRLGAGQLGLFIYKTLLRHRATRDDRVRLQLSEERVTRMATPKDENSAHRPARVFSREERF